MDEEEYTPATDPGGDRPGGDRVRFERDASGNEQSIFGGSANDIAKSIMGSTERNTQIIGARILGVRDVVGDLGDGTLQEFTMNLSNGKTIQITGIGMEVKIK